MSTLGWLFGAGSCAFLLYGVVTRFEDFMIGVGFLLLWFIVVGVATSGGKGR